MRPSSPVALVAVLAVAARLLWALNANPLLLMYDTYNTHFAKAKVHDGRRIFAPDVTRLEGKTIWVTGASSGIGAELAVQLASAGAGHLILSGRNVERLQQVAGSCQTASEERASIWKDARETKDVREVKVSLVPFDVAAGTGVLDEAVSNALEVSAPSGIDILVLNAGRYQCSPALDTDVDVALPELMQVNFAAPVQLSQKLILKDKWKERGYGHIVTISSLMGRGASPLNALYSSTKHALRGYFHSLAAEEGSWLRVDVVLPGATDTGLWSGSWNAQSSDATPEHSSHHKLHADDRSKMSVTRCAQLIVSSLMGPHALFFETWITRNPGLLWVYLASYEPMTFQLMARIVAPLRMSLWRKTGEDALYLPTLLRHLWECIVDYCRGKSDKLFP